MDLIGFRELVSPAGLELINSINQLDLTEKDYLPNFQRLSRQYSPKLVQAALETVILRRKARNKFPFAEQLFFTRAALEQASSWEIAIYRAKHFTGFERVFDLGCSIGSDTLALGQVAPTYGVDLDRLRLALARENGSALNLGERCIFINADLTWALPMSVPNSTTAFFFDPARRVAGRRLYHVDQYQPPLRIIKNWLTAYSNLAVKVSPAVNLEELSDYHCGVEFISLEGELKEAVLWFGELFRSSFKATLLPQNISLSCEEGDGIKKNRKISQPRQYLYEPDPAILRAGLVQIIANQLNAQQLDEDIAYLTSDSHVTNPFVRAWKVEDWMPFNLKHLRSYLRDRNVGQVTIKIRGSPIDPQELQHLLKLGGENERMLFLTQYQGRPIVIVAFVEKG